MRLSPDQVKQVAHLARLAIDDAEIEAYAHDLTRILDYIEQMKAVDTTGIEPMSHPLDMVQRLRPDVVTEDNRRELYQSIAPCVKDGLYLVPRIID